MAEAPSDEARELLSRHVCLASYVGLEAGREPMLRVYPPIPAKQWAVFAIDAYEEYAKPGKYGDEKQQRFAFVPEEQNEAVVSTLRSLQPNDRVRIGWRHEYVTRSFGSGEQRTSSSFPERPVDILEIL